MANTIKIKRSAVQGKIPAVGDLSLGELALNTYDGKLYTLKNNGVGSVVEIGASSGSSFSGDISLLNQSATKYYEATVNGANYIAIKAPSTLSADVTLTLPTTDGEADQVLATDGTGILSWVSRVGGSGTTGDFLSSSTASEQSGYFGNVYLKDDSNTSHYLEITNSADLTALRTLSINVNNANRSVSLSGDLTLANSLTTSGNFALTLTTTAATNVTLPTSGTLAVNNQTVYIGTTAVAINRASANLALTGITSIDGSAATLTTLRTLWGQNFSGDANVSGNLTAVGNITGTGAVTLTATGGALGLVATGANLVSITTNGTERARVDSSGNLGIGTGTQALVYKLEVNGSFAATTKSFVIPHPTRGGYRLRYGSLEGPENGVYVRGNSKEFVIELPEYWTKLVRSDSITVNLTPIGKTQTLWVKDIRNNKVHVGSKCTNIEYFYTVFAERADVEKLEPEFACEV